VRSLMVVEVRFLARIGVGEGGGLCAFISRLLPISEECSARRQTATARGS
jgi:hypothetical protein